MIYRGQFGTKDKKQIIVEIWTNTNEDYSQAEIIPIGEGGLFFGGDPVHIIRDMNDSFDTIIIHQAEIQLKTEKYIGDDLINISSNNVQVRIWENTMTDANLLFIGYADPLVFSQPYVTRLDEFTITVTDRLAQLQYYNYGGIYTKDGYEDYLSDVGYKSFSELLGYCAGVFEATNNIWYDLSVGLTSTSASTSNVFEDLSISDANIIGEEVDDVMDMKTVLDNILKYLNLHIMSIGNDFYIFNWNSIRQRRTTWYNLVDGTTKTISSPIMNFTTSLHAGDDANLTMDSIYTQVSAKADMADIDQTISSPLDKDDLMTHYSIQPYMTEIFSEGAGDTSNDSFYNMLRGADTSYDGAKNVEWYARHKYNKYWKTFILDSSDGIRKELSTFETFDNNLGEYVNQDNLWRAIYDNPCSAGIFEFGHVELQVGDKKDNSPVSKREMTSYLCFSLRGNHDNTQNGHRPNETQLLNASPVCEFKSPFNGGVYSPAVEGVTNYLVFSGKMLLQKAQKETGAYYDIKDTYNRRNYYGMCVPSKGNEGERYYTRKWLSQYSQYTPATVTNLPSFHPPRYETVENEGGTYTFPYDLDNDPITMEVILEKRRWHRGGDVDFKYNYSSPGNNYDQYYKLPILECELIIGNKRLVEYNWGRQAGQPMSVKPDYRWVTVGEEPYITITDPDGKTYQTQIKTFSIGIDPKIDDYIVGKEYEIANNVEYTMGIDATGTAIPIKASDNLAGDVTFRIVGPITTIWNEYKSHSHSWWLLWAHHYTHWTTDLKYVMSDAEMLFVKDFQCKLYTSENTYEGRDTSGKEIIYMSAEDSRIEKKDDITFQFITQPSMDTFVANNVEYQSCHNAVLNTNTKEPVSKLYAAVTTTADVPEKLYVDQYYNEYHKGKLLLQGTFHINEKTDWTKLYQLQTLNNKRFYIQKIDQGLKQNEADITFKEV